LLALLAALALLACDHAHVLHHLHQLREHLTREVPVAGAREIFDGLEQILQILLGHRARVRRHLARLLIAALESTRPITPPFNNWLLFSAAVEAGLKSLGAGWDRTRVDYALRQHEQWYKGDGAYSDGPDFHWDYYNSFVIHPLLLAILVIYALSVSSDWRETPA